MRTLFRILAIVLAVFILAGALADIFGLLPHSHVPVTARFHRNFVPMVAAVLLLVPPKSLQSGMYALFYLIALFAVNTWYSLVWMQSLAPVFPGRMHLRTIAVGLLVMAILWGTFWMAANEHFMSTSPRKRRK